MLSDVMEHFGLSKSFRQVDDFETEHHRQLLKNLKLAIYEGGLMALTGDVGQWQNGAPSALSSKVIGHVVHDDAGKHHALFDRSRRTSASP